MGPPTFLRFTWFRCLERVHGFGHFRVDVPGVLTNIHCTRTGSRSLCKAAIPTLKTNRKYVSYFDPTDMEIENYFYLAEVSKGDTEKN